jgi:RNA polymerase sigma factor (sigma-70 family)
MATNKLETLYRDFAAAPSIETTNPLLAEVRDYAYRLALRMRCPEPDEAAQNAAVCVWNRIHKFRGDSKFQTWAHATIRGSILDSISAWRRRAEIESINNDEDDEACIDAPPSPHRTPMRDYASLAPDMRHIATMLTQGYTQDEVAAAVGTSVRTLRRRILE